MLESVSNKIISFGQLGLVCQDTCCVASMSLVGHVP